MIKQKISVIDD